MSLGCELSDLQLDALRELMNIGFGQAAAALSEVIDLRVILTVPKILVLKPEEVPAFIDAEVEMPSSFSMVEQFFFGHFEGTSFLLLPEEEGRKLASLFGAEAAPLPPELETGSLERETVVEIGNIIIGACVGKIAEILKDQVAFQAPRFIEAPVDRSSLERRLAGAKDLALVFKTVFHFERQDVFGFLFLVASEGSLEWMRAAVDEYLGSLA
ncbi:MAG TPA: chemotaxis protein CheC [Spirochaetales bacterium]|nr:chemotaxis protein CheC [Spirochaetales bacterium]HRY56404.1 chemotaxis protein CheC [Spirochaetia bacterium]HRZ66282.1 chemotaxis protein CheC [Spirochaetia bacterium]